MSAHSFPSFTSDSSLLPSASDIEELTEERFFKASLTTNPIASIYLPPRGPQNSEVHLLPSKVCRLEKDKILPRGYVPELQSRVCTLECERMEHQDPINDSQTLKLVHREENNLSAMLPSSFPRHNSKPNDVYNIPLNPPSLYHPSSSFSVTTSTAAEHVLPHISSRGTPSPSSSQLPIPFANKSKPIPNHNSPVETSEVFTSTQSALSLRNCHREYESMTPTKRCLQAVRGLFSSDNLPSLGEGDPIQKNLNNYDPTGLRCSPSEHVPYTKGLYQEDTRSRQTKRPTLTSKLDSIILTSKLFPHPLSRSKTPLSPSPDQRAPISRMAVIPLAHAAASSIPHASNIVLSSPPNNNIKVQLPRKGHNLLSQSLGLEENRFPNSNVKDADRKLAPRTRRVSFSERLFSSPSERGDESDVNMEQSGRMWGSWSRKRRPPPTLSFINEIPSSSPPSSPLSTFSLRLSRSQGEHPGEFEYQRRGKRTSFAPGCLRTLMSGSGDRDKVHTADTHRDRRVLRRAPSEPRPPNSLARSHSGRSTTNSRRSEDEEHGANMNKRRITPSRVGSPMPQTRLPELQGETELERTNSMRSAGKWGHRGRGFSAELTRRRTIHPMFSFERPGSAEAVSSSSSRRGEKADGEATGDERRGTIDKSKQLPRATAGPSHRTRHEPDPSQSRATHNQGYSEASGNSGGTGVSRPEPVLLCKTPMMRTRLGMQAHGTFEFEPAAAVVCSPRSTQGTGDDLVPSVTSAEGSLSKKKGIALARSLTDTYTRGPKSSKLEGRAIDKPTKEVEYLDFCKELRAVLGDEEWSSFRKYVRRFDLEVLSAEVLVQRVKKLLDGRRSVDSATRLRLYERFVKVVHDNMNE